MVVKACYECKFGITNHGSDHDKYPYVHVDDRAGFKVAYLISKEVDAAFKKFGCDTFESKERK